MYTLYIVEGKMESFILKKTIIVGSYLGRMCKQASSINAEASTLNPWCVIQVRFSHVKDDFVARTENIFSLFNIVIFRSANLK